MQVRRVRRKWNGWEAAIICYFSSLRIEKNRTKNKIVRKNISHRNSPLAISLEMIYIGGVRARTLTPDGLPLGQPINEKIDDQDNQTRQCAGKNIFPKLKVLNWFLVRVRRRFLLAALFLGHSALQLDLFLPLWYHGGG